MTRKYTNSPWQNSQKLTRTPGRNCPRSSGELLPRWPDVSFSWEDWDFSLDWGELAATLADWPGELLTAADWATWPENFLDWSK